MEDTEVKKLVREVRTNKVYSPSEAETRLAILESYECWDTYFVLLEEMIGCTDDPKNYLIRKAVALGLSLEDIYEASKCCQLIISKFKMTYKEFTEQVARLVLAPEDWEKEAILLREVAGYFSDRPCKIACLERLCFIYERKAAEENELYRNFTEIRELDPGNVKALRYFKLIHLRNKEWDEMANCLLKLIGVSARKHEVFRYAQELATVFLYHLNDPENAIETLDKYCAGSPLDESAIRLESYNILGRWQECLDIIDLQIPQISEPSSLAVAYFRKGVFHEKLEQVSIADKCFVNALVHLPSYLEAYEHRIAIATSSLNWSLVSKLLDDLINLTSEFELRELLDDLKLRIHSLTAGIASDGMDDKQN